MSNPMPTVVVRSHGKRGWKWLLLDWDQLVADGYERTKTAALNKARSLQKEIFNQPQMQ